MNYTSGYQEVGLGNRWYNVCKNDLDKSLWKNVFKIFMNSLTSTIMYALKHSQNSHTKTPTYNHTRKIISLLSCLNLSNKIAQNLVNIY